MKSEKGVLIIGVIIILLVCLLICCILVFTGAILIPETNFPELFSRESNPLVTEEEPLATLTSTQESELGSAEKTVTPGKEAQPTEEVIILPEESDSDNSEGTLKVLQNEVVPANDLRDLAMRLEGKTNIPLTMEEESSQFSLGDQLTFWVMNIDMNEHRQIKANLAYETPHAYFWVEDSVFYEPQDLKRLAETFEEKIYPTNRAFFGSEWSPGIDHDEHLYILYAQELGAFLAGYFSSIDSIHPDAHEYSNAHETFVFNADTTRFYEDYTFGVLAHEFQHMIHWNQDRNETTWLNEGFSELAVLLNDYHVGGKDSYYAMDTDIQLTSWASDLDVSTPYYGASFLYVTYFLDRFGEQATKALVAHPENGMESVDLVFEELGIMDPSSGTLMDADSFFRDWTITNALMDPDIGDGRYIYHNYPNAPFAAYTEQINNCSKGKQTREVHQFGVDYIQIICPGTYDLKFTGAEEVNLLPEDAHSGKFMLWSNKGDESDMTMTRSFDLSGIQEPVFMEYWTWYDLEEDYDYVYVLVSEDGNAWDILSTSLGTGEDPSGNSYGWAYNGQTEGWVKDIVDLSGYVGKEIQIRFEYITDAAVNGEGFLLDDLNIKALNYSEDFEDGYGGWTGEGFVRIENSLPQEYLVHLIEIGKETTIREISLNDEKFGEMQIEIGEDIDEILLVVSGITRFTDTKAIYQFSFE
ncbi:MAG: immune inhibitor A [Anaerolineaceae bacterium]|nr:immune inhibitor A [Anaerolineaceae bacterium]